MQPKKQKMKYNAKLNFKRRRAQLQFGKINKRTCNCCMTLGNTKRKTLNGQQRYN